MPTMVLAAEPPDISVAGPMSLVDRGGAGLVDQRHAALGHAVAAEKALVGLHQHVENRIADPENVVFRCQSLISPVAAIATAAAYHDCPAPASDEAERDAFAEPYPRL